MDQNTNLHKLLEIADLAKMVEDLVAPGNLERLAPASLSGIRVTLRSIRESVLACHDSIAGELSNAARSRPEARIEAAPVAPEQSIAFPVRTEAPAIVRTAPSTEQPRMIKKDLRSTLGQVLERSIS